MALVQDREHQHELPVRVVQIRAACEVPVAVIQSRAVKVQAGARAAVHIRMQITCNHDSRVPHLSTSLGVPSSLAMSARVMMMAPNRPACGSRLSATAWARSRAARKAQARRLPRQLLCVSWPRGALRAMQPAGAARQRPRGGYWPRRPAQVSRSSQDPRRTVAVVHPHDAAEVACARPGALRHRPGVGHSLAGRDGVARRHCRVGQRGAGQADDGGCELQHSHHHAQRKQRRFP